MEANIVITVREFITNTVIEHRQKILNDLVKSKAPISMVDNARNVLRELKANPLDIYDTDKVLGFTYVSSSNHVGKGGKTYTMIETFEGVTLAYFPSGRYGRFIQKSNQNG